MPLTARWNYWWINDEPAIRRTSVRHNRNRRNVTQYLRTVDAMEDKYRQLIMLGKQLPALPDELKAQAKEIAGCENRVWLGYTVAENGKMHFFGDSEGRIVRGLLAVLLTAVEGKPPPNCRHSRRWHCLMSWDCVRSLAPHVARG